MTPVIYPALSNRVAEEVKKAMRESIRRYAASFLAEEQWDLLNQLLEQRIRPALSDLEPPEHRNTDTLLFLFGGICERMGVHFFPHGVAPLRERLDALLSGK